MTSQSSSNDPKKLSFLEKMELILGDDSLKSVISWSTDGTSFFIHDVDKFADILPRFFRSGNVASFVRQLNFYGFRKKQTSDRTTWEFYHDKFRRDRPELRSHIKRRTAPDFHLQNEQEMKDLKKENKALHTEVSKLKQRVQDLERQLKQQREANAALKAKEAGASETREEEIPRVEAVRKLPAVKRQKIEGARGFSATPPVSAQGSNASQSQRDVVDLELENLTSTLWNWPQFPSSSTMPSNASDAAAMSTTAPLGSDGPLLIRAPSLTDMDGADTAMDGVDRLASPPALMSQRSDASFDALYPPATPTYFQGTFFQDMHDPEATMKEVDPFQDISPYSDEGDAEDEGVHLSIQPPAEFMGTPLRRAAEPEDTEMKVEALSRSLSSSSLSMLELSDPRQDVSSVSEHLSNMTETEKQSLVVKLLALLLPFHLSRNASAVSSSAANPAASPDAFLQAEDAASLALAPYVSDNAYLVPKGSTRSFRPGAGEPSNIVKPILVLSLLLQQMTAHQIQTALATLGAPSLRGKKDLEAFGASTFLH